jgi:VIT1/CCC1 family predicted Fe2+/Mn2+ transporter
MKQIQREYLESAMFGFNDALVSTTGVIVGVATGVNDKRIVILAGVVTILVEALSMGAGQYISTKTGGQLEDNHDLRLAITTGLIMAVAYFIAGLVPLLAIIIFPIAYAGFVAVGAALLALFILGYVKAKIVGVARLRSALEVVIIGGLATLVGIIAGHIFGI